MGRYCGSLLHIQDDGTSQIEVYWEIFFLPEWSPCSSPARSLNPRHRDQCFAQALREQCFDERVDQEVGAGYAEGVEVAHGHESPCKV